MGKYYLVLCALILLISVPVTSKAAAIRLDQNELASTTPTSLIRIKGINQSDKEAIVVVRVDDSPSPPYNNRANIERVVPSGKFDLTLPVANLRTPQGRKLSSRSLHNIIVFTGRETDQLVFSLVSIVAPPSLGAGVRGWDLGPPGSAVWPGFEPLTPESPYLIGPVMTSIDRSRRMHAADSLTSDGIRGIDTISLPLTNGRWQITLWITDPGEWEFMPHPLSRKITAEDKVIFQQSLTPSQWIKQKYLARSTIPVTPHSSSWSHFGSQISDRVTTEQQVDNDGLQLQLTGDSPDARFVAAILAVPASQSDALDRLDTRRGYWWRNNWPVEDWKAWPSGLSSLNPDTQQSTAVPDTSARFEFSFEQGNEKGSPMPIVTPPTMGKQALPTTLYWSEWQLERSHLSSTLLVPTNSLLKSGALPENKGLALPRRLILHVSIPEGTPAGNYMSATVQN